MYQETRVAEFQQSVFQQLHGHHCRHRLCHGNIRKMLSVRMGNLPLFVRHAIRPEQQLLLVMQHRHTRSGNFILPDTLFHNTFCPLFQQALRLLFHVQRRLSFQNSA